jgi:hypothetical protein
LTVVSVTPPASIKAFFMEQKNEIKSGTLMGTAFTLLCSVQWPEIEKTFVLGAIGAFSSFLVSYGLQKLLARWSKK